jgi:hypothetical protein
MARVVTWQRTVKCSCLNRQRAVWAYMYCANELTAYLLEMLLAHVTTSGTLHVLDWSNGIVGNVMAAAD